MKPFTFFVFIFALSIFGCKDDDSNNVEPPNVNDFNSGLSSDTLMWEGRSRTYNTYYPSEEHREKSLPILFVLHGGGGTATQIMNSTLARFNNLANRDGFIVVYPDGVEKAWNDGRQTPELGIAWAANIDDVGFIAEIASLLISKYSIDESKIFTSGISNGGFMSTRLLCDRADLFKGGAIVTATISEEYLEKCNPSEPNSVIVFNSNFN